MKFLKLIIKQSWKFYIINLLFCVLFFSLIFASIINIYFGDVEVKSTRYFKDKNIYQISDQLFDRKEQEFFLKRNGYDVLSDFVQVIDSSKDFAYYNAIWQPIGVFEFLGDETFSAYYEFGNQGKPYIKDGKSYEMIKSLQINHTVLENFTLLLNGGRLFNSEEFIYDETSSDSIPIILGNSYKNIYDLGSTIQVNYYGKEFTGEIIGILNQNQRIMTNNDPEIILDRYIILPLRTFFISPSQLLVNDASNELFYRASLLSQANGMIISDLSATKIESNIKNIGKNVGFTEFQLIGANSLAVNVLMRMIETNIYFIYSLMVLLFLISLTIIIYSIFLRIKRNIDTFLVLLISGTDFSSLKKIIRFEVLVMLLISLPIPLVPFLFIVVRSPELLIYYFSLVLVTISVLFILVNLYIDRIFKSINIIKKLKG